MLTSELFGLPTILDKGTQEKLNYGGAVKVLNPPALQTQVQDVIDKIVAKYR